MRSALETFDFSALDIDAYLDLRDADPFQAQWQAAFEAVEAGKAGQKPHIRKLLDRDNALERERVFKQVFRASGSSELAAYLSDDVGLLYEAEFLHVENDFLNEMVQAYAAGRLPGLEEE